jgi:imidazolonepropionase-like amidohydrolase
MSRRLIALALALLAPLASTQAQTIAIVGGDVYTVANPQPIKGGTVLVRDGRIVAVGRDVAVPAGAQVIDAKGQWVTPGLFHPYSNTALMDTPGVGEADDRRAADSPFQASLDMQYVVNPASDVVRVTRMEGVTRAMVAPVNTRSMLAGYGALIHLGDATELVFKPQAFELAQLGERGGDLAGGSRAAAFLALQNALLEARQYEVNRGRYIQGGHREALTNRVDTEALIPVARGDIPLLVRVDRAHDIRMALKLRQEVGKINLILVGVAEGWLVADELAAAKVPVIVFPYDNLPGRFDQFGATMANAGRMMAKGVTVAIGPGPERDAEQNARLLPQAAGNVVGMSAVAGAPTVSWAQAFEAITLTPARLYGVADQLGTLERGKLADVVVWTGDPLELSSAPTAVLINGRPVALTSRQTELRDRYLSLKRGDLPIQYKR